MRNTPSNPAELSLPRVAAQAREEPAALIAQWENRYEMQLKAIADHLLAGHGRCKVLLLAGPSASGKTTTAQKLSRLLEQGGVQAPVVSLDDFFVGRGQYPRTADGHEDFESVYGLDLERIHRDLGQLIGEGHAIFPVYDFLAGRRSEQTRPISLGEGDLLLVEGIHALNPLLSQSLPQDRLCRAYVSVTSAFVQGEETVLAPADLRLVRRLIRDCNYRGYPAYKTLSRWESVLAGELANILPYREQADFTVDSTLGYEPCLYRERLARYVGEEEHRRHGPLLARLKAALERFPVLEAELVPADSLLWEFLRPEETVEIRRGDGV